MKIIELATSSDLAYVSVLAALEELNKQEASTLKKSVDFVELQYAPDLQQMTVAEHVAIKLLKHGVGVKLSVHWAFAGSTKWALQTERTRVVSGI